MCLRFLKNQSALCTTLPACLVSNSFSRNCLFNKRRTCLRQKEATIFDILRLASARGKTVDLIVLFLIYTCLRSVDGRKKWPSTKH